MKKKVYITLNYYEGWKVVLDGRVVDSTKPIFHSMDITIKGLNMCRNFCKKTIMKLLESVVKIMILRKAKLWVMSVILI